MVTMLQTNMEFIFTIRSKLGDLTDPISILNLHLRSLFPQSWKKDHAFPQLSPMIGIPLLANEYMGGAS